MRVVQGRHGRTARGLAARVLASFGLCGMVAAGCAPAVSPVSLPEKKVSSIPALGVPLSAWTPAQLRVKLAYHAAQVALKSASDSQDATRAQAILAGHILPADLASFVAGMAANWQLGEVSSGVIAYRVEGITFKGPTALVQTCWAAKAFAARVAATGKLVLPLPKDSRHSITLMGFVHGRWLQGKSIRANSPCSAPKPAG